MKTEEKAKAYDEALEQAQKELAVCGSINCDAARQIFRLFPQLRESEDKRTRKWLVNLVENLGEPADEDAEKELDEMRPLALAYLEKQKDHFRDDTKMVEQKSAENGVDIIKTSALLAADRLASAEMTGRLKERSEILENPEEYGLQKPAEWSEEDENMMNRLIGVLDGTNKEDYHEGWEEIFLPWLKSFRPQPKQEWSEEDKKIYQTVFNHFNSYITFTCSNGVKKEHILSWLKSLRPQSKEELAKMLQEEYNKGKKEGERIGHTRGYNKGYKDAKEECNKALSYHP